MINSSSDAHPFPLPPSPAVNRSERRHRRLPASNERPLGGRRQARRRHVDGFLEERAVERIGFVEQAEHLEPPVDHEPFERDFGTRHEVLNQDRPAASRLLDDSRETLERGCESPRVVGANHAARGREPQRLEHAGVARTRGERVRVLVEPVQLEPRHRHAVAGELAPLHVLVARGERGRRRIPPEPQSSGDHGGHDGAVVIHADDPRDRMASSELGGLLGRALRVGEVERHEPVGLCVLEGAGELGRDGQLDAQPARRLHERRGPVRRGGQQQQQPGLGGARHGRALTFWTRRSRGWRPRCDR